MKKILLSGLALLSAVVLLAGNINEQTAGIVAQSKLAQMGKSDEYSIKRIIPVPDHTWSTIFYMIELAPTGYVVVASDDVLPPVVAYAFENSWYSEETQTNPLIDLLSADVAIRLTRIYSLTPNLRHDYSREWEMMTQGTATSEAGFQQWPPEGTTTTGGWMETKWTQSAPYNNFCPLDPVSGNRSIAGCPAVAMAQIVNYYQTINGTVLDNGDDYYHSYAGRNYWIDDDFEAQDFPSFPELNDWLDSLVNCWIKQLGLGSEEKAALTFACGVAAKQVYTSTAAGTFGVNQAFDAYSRFGFGSAELLYDTDTSLYDVLSQNMKDARPAHLAVVDPQWSSGHNLVVDGYNTDDYYHLNFGWGGPYNGWYLIPEGIPYNLTVMEGVIVNIADPPTSVPSASGKNISAMKVYPSCFRENLTIELAIPFPAGASLEIMNSNGKVICTLQIPAASNGKTMVLWNGHTDKGAPLPQGLYLIRIKGVHGIEPVKCIRIE